MIYGFFSLKKIPLQIDHMEATNRSSRKQKLTACVFCEASIPFKIYSEYIYIYLQTVSHVLDQVGQQLLQGRDSKAVLLSPIAINLNNDFPIIFKLGAGDA